MKGDIHIISYPGRVVHGAPSVRNSRRFVFFARVLFEVYDRRFSSGVFTTDVVAGRAKRTKRILCRK